MICPQRTRTTPTNPSRRVSGIPTGPDVERRGPHLLRVKVYTSDMRNAGIHPGDIVIVDESREPQEGDIVCVEWHRCVRAIRRLVHQDGEAWLMSATPGKERMSPKGSRLVGVVVRVVRR